MSSSVSLVIPGRNCERTIDRCLSAVVAIQESCPDVLREILFVDDGSVDRTRALVEGHPVTLIPGSGQGPGAARNLGWRVATSSLVWFVDSDCVAHPEALETLLPHFDDSSVGAVSGTYGNASEESLLGCLIHEEIVERHHRMGREVDFLATFNVIYRRTILEELEGFDERYLKAQDAELSFRTRAAGHRLHFEMESVVDHYHEQRLRSYLKTQRQQGYWRVWLHLEHPGHAAKNSYSGALDHLQPMVAMGALGSAVLWFLPFGWSVTVLLVILLFAMQIPMTLSLMKRTGQSRFVMFAAMSAVRSVWRGIGLSHGVLAFAFRRKVRS